MTIRRAVFLAVLAAAVAAGCSRSRPSVILVSIDSLRYDDAFGRVGNREIAPRLAGLARESVNYERAYTSAPWTTPAMMSVLTDLPPPAHGVEEHDRALAASVETLAERFRAASYRTGAILPSITLRSEFGFGRGFEVFDLENFGHERVTSPVLMGKALQRVDNWRREGRPFFLWVHLWDPHFNYIPPPPYNETFAGGSRPADENVACLKWAENPLAPPEVAYLRGQYRGEIAFTDKYVGELLDYLEANGLKDRVVLVVLGDHGEAFQEHGWLSHTNRVDEEVVHVPLMIRWPGRLAPRRATEVVSTAQVGATLLDLVGLGARPFGDEPPLPTASTAPPAATVLSETVRQGCYTTLVSPRWKYVLDHRSCGESLFDLDADPGETRDLAGVQKNELAARRAAMRDELQRLRGLNIPKAALPAAVVREAEAALRSLGYLGGGKSGNDAPANCPAAPRTGKRDTFGDLATEPCPLDGAWACLAKLP